MLRNILEEFVKTVNVGLCRFGIMGIKAHPSNFNPLHVHPERSTIK
jgi:hypothetical protein